MNLIKRNTNDVVDLLLYREYQYSMISEFIDICFDYCTRFGFDYDKSKLVFNIEEDNDYFSKNYYAFDKLKIKLNPNDKNNFLELNIPRLIHNTFFILRGVYYIPLIYILDVPVVIQKKIIKIYSLFKPITIFIKEKRITIDNKNYHLYNFLRLYLDDYTIKEVFNVEPIISSRVLHKDYIEKIFFDKWTKELYCNYYKLDDINMKKVIDIVINNMNNKIEFNDIRYKRLVFIELLLDPLFRATNKFINKFDNKFPINIDAIISHFYKSDIDILGQSRSKGLSGNTFYSIVNGYSGILSNKASFKNPKVSTELPKSISNIHESHKYKICPVTISNKNPGVLISLVPDQKINLRYGIFEDN